MQSPQAKLKEITRLLASWPSAAAAVDGDEQLRSYLLAVEDYPAPDVEAAITMLIKGTAPGVNPNYLPAPAAVGAECRRQMNLRLDRERRGAKPRRMLPLAPRTAESKAKFAEVVDQIVSNLAAVKDEANPSSEAGRQSIFERTNARFDADRYGAGDPDGERDMA